VSGSPGTVRFLVRVHPGAARDSVGGTSGPEDEPALVVRVRAPAADGRANAAAIAVLAAALGVRKVDVRIVRGRSSRTKLVEADHVDRARLDELRAT